MPKAKQLPTLQLTIDARLQRAAEKAVADGMADSRTRSATIPTGGSAVAINPWTGAIYAIASYPTFNQVLAATTRTTSRASTHDTTRTPTLNRAIAGVYPTGSTFKPIIAEAALAGRDHHAVHAAALLRLVRPRQPHLLQRRGGRRTRR